MSKVTELKPRDGAERSNDQLYEIVQSLQGALCSLTCARAVIIDENDTEKNEMIARAIWVRHDVEQAIEAARDELDGFHTRHECFAKRGAA